MPATTATTSRAAGLTRWARQLTGRDAGVLPVVVGLVALIVYFQVKNSAFLSAGNIVDLIIQGLAFVMLGFAEVWVLLLGEIDLSIGFVAGMGAVVTGILVGPSVGAPWWLAILAGLAATASIGAIQGTIIIRLRLPSFVVTLAGYLFWEGLVIYLIDGQTGQGTIPFTQNQLADLTYGNLSTVAGWIVAVAVVVLYGGYTLMRDRRLRANGLVAPARLVTAAKVAVIAVASVVVVLVCNTNRGILVTVEGVPIGLLIILGFLVVWTFVLNRTRFGRYVYAIGGNAEAARRAGVNVGRNKLYAFMLCSLTAGAAGILYASRLGSISTDIDGGTLVLYGVAAAVIGGTSLFGGRGKMVHAFIGGFVIATIYNGMSLLSLQAAVQFMWTAVVLLAAVTIDALARRGVATR
jgi:D-xylose transport system permease protein